MKNPKTVSRTVLLNSELFQIERISVDFDIDQRSPVLLEKIAMNKPISVIVIPILSDKIIMVKEYGAGIESYVLKLPTGRIESGKSAKETALRELREEISMQAVDLVSLGTLLDEPGHSNALTEVVLAQELSYASGIGDEPEPLGVFPTPLSELLMFIKRGKLTDSRSIAALFHFCLYSNIIIKF